MSNPVPARGLEALGDMTTAHACGPWNARRQLLVMDSHQVNGTTYSGPAGHELGPRLQELWHAEARSLLSDLATAMQGLPRSDVLAFEQYAHGVIHQAAMEALPEPADAEPADAAEALDAERDADTGQVPVA